jgi:hypothetical protein
VVRTGLAVLLALAGVAWLTYYLLHVQDAGSPGWAADLGRWNYAIGFGLVYLGLAVSAHPSTPLGRGRGVVVGMLGCFLLGLVWIVVYYLFSQENDVPLLSDLGQYNLLVGIGFMATGFVFATRWE